MPNDVLLLGHVFFSSQHAVRSALCHFRSSNQGRKGVVCVVEGGQGVEYRPVLFTAKIKNEKETTNEPEL